MNLNAGSDFDPEAVGRVRRLGGDDLLARVSRLFIETGRQRLGELAKSADQGDLQGVARAAHSLLGSAGNLGAVTVMRLATEVEQAATASRASEIPTLVAQLNDAMAVAEARFTPHGPAGR